MRLLFFSLIISFFPCISADELLSKRAEAVLDSALFRMPAPSIIGKREWNELQLDRLITMLDRTKTSFGRWGLVTLLHPIASKHHLDQRKKIITFLLDHPDVMKTFQQQLELVQQSEESLLAYWDKNDQLDRSCQSFYFSAPGLSDLNKSSIALNVSTVMEGFNAIKDLLRICAMWGIANEMLLWSLGIKEEFNIWEGAKIGLTDPIMRHSPWLYKLSEGPYTGRDIVQAASWGDTFNVWKYGFSYGGPQNDKNSIPGIGPLGAAMTATMTTLFYDYQWVSTIDFIGRRIISMHRNLNQLQHRVSDVAHCINSIKKLHNIIASQNDEFSKQFDIPDSDHVTLFIKNVTAKRFLQKQKYVYSRGHILAMHQDIKRIKRSLIPLLHSIALLDAYCSIAQLYQESQNEHNSFCFPEFIESPMPVIRYYDAWLPLLPSDSAVANNLFFGGDQPSKVVITGPNGGGKSTILKTEGIAAVLAQGWGIVPAQKAQQTMLSAIRTSLAPYEDISRGLSTFMAEKKVMTELLDDICKSDEHHRVLALIDEPYKGTVDDESAKRIYQFGKEVANFSQALIAIATHVKKPIFLEQETNGIFGNYQVNIREQSRGIFERLFKLEKGPAMWWFDDEDQRSRFIDWISVKSDVAD